MYLVYKTDSHLSYSSRDIIGVCTTKINAIKVIRAKIKKEGETLTSDELFNLNNIQQTYNYSGEGNFQFEALKTNILL